MTNIIEKLTEGLKSGFGAWSSLVLVLVFLVAFLLVYIIWKKGNQSYQKRTMQVQPFLSGNALEDPEDGHVPADNLFWGFKHALRDYYKLAEEAHTGSLNDYAAWFVVVFAIMLIAITLGGA